MSHNYYRFKRDVPDNLLIENGYPLKGLTKYDGTEFICGRDSDEDLESDLAPWLLETLTHAQVMALSRTYHGIHEDGYLEDPRVEV